MFAAKLLRVAILVAALGRADNASVVTVGESTATVLAGGLANATQQLVQLTTVGLSTVTVFSNQQKPPQTTVTFTPGNSIAGLEVTMTPIPASQLSELTATVLVNTSAVANLTVSTANLTWSATTVDATASSVATGTSSLGASTATQPGPTTTNSTNQAAETSILVGRSLKAMAVGFLLALAL
ncbi:hypothetical protein QBC40DRAFT_338598 [Triangularia verruculosa]|uniref:Uncharacterized protein n=1 Tax=Triangularia verruculosa TaxID=2587418 RepID=A0AAN6XJX7_9PEZI|nr:hypothetical protein QBC40DRAFT_338598 [Triangularia verruculosa]